MFELLTPIYRIFKIKMPLWTMEEEAKSKSAVIFIFHKGVFRDSFHRMFMDCETVESFCHPRSSPAVSGKLLFCFTLSTAVLITSQEGRKYSLLHIHVSIHAKKLEFLLSCTDKEEKK